MYWFKTFSSRPHIGRGERLWSYFHLVINFHPRIADNECASHWEAGFAALIPTGQWMSRGVAVYGLGSENVLIRRTSLSLAKSILSLLDIILCGWCLSMWCIPTASIWKDAAKSSSDYDARPTFSSVVSLRKPKINGGRFCLDYLLSQLSTL